MKLIPPIAERNSSIEPLVQASCLYGRHGNGKRNVEKQFSMLAVTDIHHTVAQLQNAIDYLNYQDALDCGICLGDIQGSNFSETAGTWYTESVLKSEKPFLTVLGNHDVGNSTRADVSATSQEAFEEFISPTLPVMGLETCEKPYYVKYFDEYKLVLICLDNYDAPDARDENGDFIIPRGEVVYSQTQLDWLIETMRRIPADYHLLVCLHSYPYGMLVSEDCGWSQKPLYFYGEEKSIYRERLSYYKENTPYGSNSILGDIVNAWIKGCPLKADYAPTAYKSILPTLHVDCDFSSRGSGIFAAYLMGHLHWDMIGHTEAYPDQNVIALPSSALDTWQNYCCDLPRIEGTKSEDAITVVSVCTGLREIRLVRIGSDMTFDMRERKYCVIPYGDK